MLVSVLFWCFLRGLSCVQFVIIFVIMFVIILSMVRVVMFVVICVVTSVLIFVRGRVRGGRGDHRSPLPPLFAWWLFVLLVSRGSSSGGMLRCLVLC